MYTLFSDLTDVLSVYQMQQILDPEILVPGNCKPLLDRDQMFCRNLLEHTNRSSRNYRAVYIKMHLYYMNTLNLVQFL